MKLRVVSAAEDELVEGAGWYEDRQCDLGARFIDEYQDAILRILSAPGSYARLETTRSRRNLRRCFLKRFPYYVGYELLADEIVVLAVAHTKRRPKLLDCPTLIRVDVPAGYVAREAVWMFVSKLGFGNYRDPARWNCPRR